LSAAVVPRPCVAFLGSIAGLIPGLQSRAEIGPTSILRSGSGPSRVVVVSRPGGAPRARGLMLNSLFCEDKGQIDGKAVRQGSQASCITGCLNDRSKAR